MSRFYKYEETVKVIQWVSDEETGNAIEVGQTLTTQKSGVTGIITRIDATNFEGMFRVRLSVEGVERWTTYQFSTEGGE